MAIKTPSASNLVFSLVLMFLTRFAKSVTLIHRRETFRASAIMVERAKNNPKINFILNSVVEEIYDVESGSVNGLLVKNIKTNEKTKLEADGVFIAIGHHPNTDLFANQLDLDESGYIITDGVKTNIPGVFAAGDVMDTVYKQAVTAAGSGCRAALEAQWYLENLEANSDHDKNKEKMLVD